MYKYHILWYNIIVQGRRYIRMLQYLVDNPVIAIIFLLIVVAATVFLLVKFVQHVGLEKVRKITYDLIRKAERKFEQGANEQKFEYVVQLARSAIPDPFNLLITEKLLRKTVQLWFNLVKDFLDDLKLNGTGKEEE
jgi:hypothetical protein